MWLVSRLTDLFFLGLSRFALEAKLRGNIQAKKDLKERYQETVAHFDRIKAELFAHPTVLPELNTFLQWAMDQHRRNATVTVNDGLYVVDKYVGDVLTKITPLFLATNKLSTLIDETHKINKALEVAEEEELKAKFEREKRKVVDRREKRSTAIGEEQVFKKRRYNKKGDSI